MAQPQVEWGHESSFEPSHPTPIAPGRPRELALSAAWHGALVRNLHTTEGEAIEVIFRGVWTHGFGPDFQDALLAFADGGLRTGAVEIHHRTADWRAHGHHLDPNFNAVILHLVRHHDGAETRRADGAIIPTALLPVSLETLDAIDRRLPGIWDRLGGAVCAETLTRHHPERIRGVLHRLGDRRLAERFAARGDGALHHRIVGGLLGRRRPALAVTPDPRGVELAQAVDRLRGPCAEQGVVAAEDEAPRPPVARVV